MLNTFIIWTLAAGLLLSVSCIFVADGVKTWLQGEDSLEVEPLLCLGGILGCKVAFWLIYSARSPIRV